MIVKEFQLENAKVLVDDSFLPKTEEERQQRYELFNSIGCEIISSSIS
ncbi:MAG: hypothetical protein K1W33_06950 [Clostridia bacterium]